jgi:hypothetical protein
MAEWEEKESTEGRLARMYNLPDLHMYSLVLTVYLAEEIVYFFRLYHSAKENIYSKI